MSVTIETIPAGIKSVYRPVIWEVSSDRFDAIDSAFTVDDISNSGGKVRLQTTATHNYVIGDQIELEDAADERYNGLQRVTLVPSGTEVDTTKDFFSAEGASPVKTVTLRNNNFQIRGEINVYNGALVAITGFVDNTSFITGTTSIPHLLVVGSRIEVRDTTSYNDLHIVVGIPSATEFEIVVAFVASETGNVVKTVVRGIKRQPAVIIGGANRFRFNVAGILKAQLNFDLKALNTSSIDTPNDGSIEDYFMQFFEEHHDEDSFVQEFASLISTNEQVLNGTHQHTETQNFDDFLLDGVTKKFLTNAPRTQKKEFDEEFQLSFITELPNVQARFERFDNNGASIGIAASPVIEIIRNRGIFACNSTIFTTIHSRIEIFIFDTDGAVQISERFNFTRETRCFKDPVRVHWLNRLGGFDAFTFSGDRRETIKQKRTSFEKNLDPDFDIQDRGVTTLGVVANEEVQVWSEFISEAFQRWLTELITSPEVYLEVGDDLIPIDTRTTQLQFLRHSKMIQARYRFAMPEIIVQQG